MRLRFTGVFIAINMFANLFAQNQLNEGSTSGKKYTCGSETPPITWDNWFNARVDEFKSRQNAGKTQLSSITIPVIVHVIHGGQATGTFPNISQAQIKSQISVLNKDFSGNGFNVSQLATKGFSTVGAANCMVSFCLAQSDPDGNPLSEPGIERINYSSKGWTNPASFTNNTNLKNYIDGTIKPNSIWDPSLYFNIWVTDVNSSGGSAVNLLGYATFPAGSGLSGINSSMGTSTSDGIWVWAKAFGSTGTLLSGYERGRTATHEVGHWLGLRHIGGDALNTVGDCNATDFCDDTPPQMGGNSGGSNGQNFGSPAYPLFPNQCGSEYGNMYMNFMDYTYDDSKYMFTPDQALRIQTAMANGYFRNQLNASSANLCSGTPIADFYLDSMACNDSEINILDFSTGTPAPSYSWTVKPEDGVTFLPNNTAINPKISYSYPNTYTISVTITNSIGISSATYSQQVFDCTGISSKKSESGSWSLFPNPSQGELILKSGSENEKHIQLTVLNALGQLMYTTEFEPLSKNETRLNLSFLDDGVYALIISSGNKKQTNRLIISK